MAREGWYAFPMEAHYLAEDAMRERVALQHLAQNVLTDTVIVELAQKVMPELPETIAEWSLDDIRRLMPLLDTEASRITQTTCPDVDLSAYDCDQIFRTRITLLQTLLRSPRPHLTPWQFSGMLAEARQTLNGHITTRQGIKDVATHFAGLATAAALAHNDITPPPPENPSWGDTEEWKGLRTTIRGVCEKVRKEVMMGN